MRTSAHVTQSHTCMKVKEYPTSYTIHATSRQYIEHNTKHGYIGRYLVSITFYIWLSIMWTPHTVKAHLTQSRTITATKHQRKGTTSIEHECSLIKVAGHLYLHDYFIACAQNSECCRAYVSSYLRRNCADRPFNEVSRQRNKAENQCDC